MSNPNSLTSPSLLGNPATHAFAITPADDTDLAYVTRALYIGGEGDVEVITLGGETVIFSAVPVGAILPIQCSRVKDGNTTATLILGLY